METARQRGRSTKRHSNREADNQRANLRHTGCVINRETERRRDRETERLRDRETERLRD